MLVLVILFFFFFNDTATTEIYTLSLHDALPILALARSFNVPAKEQMQFAIRVEAFNVLNHTRLAPPKDRKSTRLNSSHLVISYAVFCLKKKKQQKLNVNHIQSSLTLY